MLTTPEKTLQLWKLSDEQIAKIKSIAQRFLELENIIRQESQKIKSALDIRVLDQDDWVQDFEIEATMTCYISESDIDYDVDEDNILCVVPDYNIKNQRDWNEQLDSRFVGNFHCGSFWWLYSAMQISWENILRIDSIYLDLNVVYQKNLKIL
ncbi:MAG: hypothetical protein WC272_06265 [Sulfurimonas sp.]|jgi:hypothetical protein